MRRARLLLPLLIVATLVAALVAAPAVAAPPAQATDTPTPDYQLTYVLDSSNVVVIERRATFGDLAVFSALIVLIALLALCMAYVLIHFLLR